MIFSTRNRGGGYIGSSTSAAANPANASTPAAGPCRRPACCVHEEAAGQGGGGCGRTSSSSPRRGAEEEAGGADWPAYSRCRHRGPRKRMRCFQSRCQCSTAAAGCQMPATQETWSPPPKIQTTPPLLFPFVRRSRFRRRRRRRGRRRGQPNKRMSFSRHRAPGSSGPADAGGRAKLRIHLPTRSPLGSATRKHTFADVRPDVYQVSKFISRQPGY